MNEKSLKLKKSPIVEAVVDIECDQPSGQSIAALEEPAIAVFRDTYSKFRKQIYHEQNIEKSTTEANKLTLKLRGSVQALQFLHEDERQLVQIRTQGFSFNRLSPYTSLDDYLPEIARTWRLYIGLASPVQVRAIRLRYINRMLLPITAGSLDLDTFLKTGPRLPDEEKLTFAGFLNQYTAVEKGTKNVVNVVLTVEELDEDRCPVIFDISAAVTADVEPENWTSILSTIQELRNLKNCIFKDTLTEKCLSLFQQP